jgi:hypothetical protein
MSTLNERFGLVGYDACSHGRGIERADCSEAIAKLDLRDDLSAITLTLIKHQEQS